MTHTDKNIEQKDIKLIEDILELKTPLFSIRIGDKDENTKYELFADGRCIGTKKGEVKENIFIINYYRAALSIACGLPAKTLTVVNESKLFSSLAPYFDNKDLKKGK